MITRVNVLEMFVNKINEQPHIESALKKSITERAELLKEKLSEMDQILDDLYTGKSITIEQQRQLNERKNELADEIADLKKDVSNANQY
jgi:hypothetical protein